MLSKEQNAALSCCKFNKSIFITGPGGVGKSYFIKELVKEFPNTVVTALTGCAAILLGCGAQTIHSWSGIGIGGDKNSVLRRVMRNKFAVGRWRICKILVIDEISMMSKDMFDTLDFVARKVRKNDRFFGGIQLVCSGDFHQLPPVEGESCAESKLWKYLKRIEFKTNYRQKDNLWLSILNQIRVGQLESKYEETLIERIQPPPSDIVTLLPKRKMVDEINHSKYNEISQPEVKYTMKPVIEKNNWTKEQLANFEIKIKKLVSQVLVDKVVRLKVGCRVMLVCNLDLDRELINGSQGVVTKLTKQSCVVKFDNGVTETITPHTWLCGEEHKGKEIKVGIKQMPLILSYAISIHKAQGMTLERAYIDCGVDIFDYRQIYVALSRVKTLSGLYLKNLAINTV